MSTESPDSHVIPLAPDSVRDDVAVTIYNRGSALIRDTRSFEFQAGLNRVDFTGVASSIDATSVNFRSVTAPDTVVLEQNYVYDLVDDNALLRRFIDQTIEVTMLSLTDKNNTFRGQLLGTQGAIILRLESGEIVSLRGKPLDIRFPDLPAGLVTRPTLRWLLQSVETGSQQVELTYLTHGLTWTADYTIILGTDNTVLDLNGWVTLNNTSGAAYENAQVKLVAGDVNRIQPERRPRGKMLAMAAMEEAAPLPQVEQRELFEYQLYEIARRVTVGDNETKQVEFVNGTGIPARRYYMYTPNGNLSFPGDPILARDFGLNAKQKVQTHLEFNTGKDNGGLGADLPAGRIRVYQPDVDGAALLIGENKINHTPEGETVDLLLGNAFDLVAERVQTDYQHIGEKVIEESFEIRLRNRKDSETVTIRVDEVLYRWTNWQILESNLPYERTAARKIEFNVEVPPGGESVLTYTVRYSWR